MEALNVKGEDVDDVQPLDFSRHSKSDSSTSAVSESDASHEHSSDYFVPQMRMSSPRTSTSSPEGSVPLRTPQAFRRYQPLSPPQLQAIPHPTILHGLLAPANNDARIDPSLLMMNQNSLAQQHQQHQQQQILLQMASGFQVPLLGNDVPSSMAELIKEKPKAKKKKGSLPEDLKDEAYWERRRKNNEAAKRSRDTKRAKQDITSMKAVLLEQENLKLHVQVAALRSELNRMRSLLYARNC